MSNPPTELQPRPMSPRQRFWLGAGLFTAVALVLQQKACFLLKQKASLPLQEKACRLLQHKAF